MKISRIFQLLPVLAFGIMCCLLSGCAKKCIVPRPTLACAENGLLYKPDAGIAGVTQIKLTVSDAATNALILDTLLAPGGSLLIPSSALASSVLVVSEYLPASGRPVARDEQILDGLCRTAIVTMDVVITTPAVSECDTLTTCTNMSSPASSHTINWNNRDVKIVVQNVSFLARWASDHVDVSSCNPDIANNFSTANSTLTYDDKQGNNGVNFTVTFTAASNQTTVSINSNVSGGVTTGTCQ